MMRIGLLIFEAIGGTVALSLPATADAPLGYIRVRASRLRRGTAARPDVVTVASDDSADVIIDLVSSPPPS